MGVRKFFGLRTILTVFLSMRGIGSVLCLVGALIASTVHAAMIRPINNWEYSPVDEEQWAALEKASRDKNYAWIAENAQKKMQTQKGTLIEAEALVYLIEILRQKNYEVLPYYLALKMNSFLPSSEPAYRSLKALEDYQKKYRWTHPKVIELFTSGRMTEVPETYYPWTLWLLGEEPREGFWRHQWRWDRVRQEVLSSGDLDRGTRQAQELLDDPQLPQDLKNQVHLWLARWYFQKKNYFKALEFYEKHLPDPLMPYQISLEKAWAYYWLRKFPEVFGIIHTLRSPQYKNYQSPELYLLEMLSLRYLCYFDEIKTSADRFAAEYGGSIEKIKKNQDLKNDLALAKWTLMDVELNGEWQFMYLWNQEKEALAKESFLPAGLRDLLISQVQSFVGQISLEADYRYHRAVTEKARELLDYYEQVKLMEYLTALDKTMGPQARSKVDDGEQRLEFRSTFKQLFWPFKKEYWMDEISYYQVFTEDLCAK